MTTDYIITRFVDWDNMPRFTKQQLRDSEHEWRRILIRKSRLGNETAKWILSLLSELFDDH